jgi:hypothetical protein
MVFKVDAASRRVYFVATFSKQCLLTNELISMIDLPFAISHFPFSNADSAPIKAEMRPPVFNMENGE